MALLLEHWSFDPTMIVLIAVALLHARGYRLFTVMSVPRRAFALATANLVMVVVAVSLGLFSTHAYSVYGYVPHRVMSQGTDQNLAAGLLWICGEFTLAPALYFVVQGWFRQEEEAADRAESLLRLRARVSR